MQRSTIATASLWISVAMASLAVADDWPQWRGPERTGISEEKGLLQQWPADGPALRWKATDIGTGYSSPAVVGGRVYVQTTREKKEYTLALDEKTGKEVWSVEIGEVGVNRGPQYPGTRSTPTIVGDRIYCLASAGELVCLQAADGKSVWKAHLQKDFAGEPGMWAYSESVLVDGDLVICTPGGNSASLAALKKDTGEVVWKSAVPDAGTAEYASIMRADDGKVQQYIQFLRSGIVGVEAKTGKFLWKYGKTVDQGANILTPVVSGKRVFSAGSRTGGGAVELVPGANPKELFFDRGLGSGIGGAVLVDGHLYGTGQVLFCADFNTGKTLWSNRSVGAASLCYADGRLYVRGHNTGEVAIVEASPKEYVEVGRLKQPDRSQSPAWPHPVVANGGLYLRDHGVLLCYEVQAQPAK